MKRPNKLLRALGIRRMCIKPKAHLFTALSGFWLVFTAFACLTMEGAGSAKTVGVTQKTQKEYGISVTRRLVGWPDGVVEFRVTCPSTRGEETFDSLSVDLVNEKKEFHFRSMVSTSKTNGMERGFFLVHQSKIKDCTCGIAYGSTKGDLTVYIVDLTSYRDSKDAE